MRVVLLRVVRVLRTAGYAIGIGVMLGVVAVAGIVQGNAWLVLVGLGGAAILVAMWRYVGPYLQRRHRT